MCLSVHRVQVGGEPGVLDGGVVAALSEGRITPSGEVVLFDSLGRRLDDLLCQCCHVNLSCGLDEFKSLDFMTTITFVSKPKLN